MRDSPLPAGLALAAALWAALPASMAPAAPRSPMTREAEELTVEFRSRITEDSAALDKALTEFDKAVSELEELAKTYASSSDPDSVGPAREALRKRVAEKGALADDAIERVDELRGKLQTRQALWFVTEAAQSRKDDASRERRGKARKPLKLEKKTVDSEMAQIAGLWKVIDHAKTRHSGLMARVSAEAAAFAREREASLRLRRLRAVGAAGFGLLLLAAAWVSWRRSRA